MRNMPKKNRESRSESGGQDGLVVFFYEMSGAQVIQCSRCHVIPSNEPSEELEPVELLNLDIQKKEAEVEEIIDVLGLRRLFDE